MTEEQKAAKREYMRRYNARNRDALKERRRRYYLQNRDAVLARTKAYQAVNKDAAVVQRKAHYEANKDAVYAQVKAWRVANNPAGSARMTWQAMKQRCLNPNNSFYHRYGGRGIKIDPRWLGRGGGFHNFLADVGERPSRKHTLHRLHNDLGYEPGNCVWSTDHRECHLTRFLTPLQRRELFKSIPAI
jgi:hypothetical protein